MPFHFFTPTDTQQTAINGLIAAARNEAETVERSKKITKKVKKHIGEAVKSLEHFSQRFTPEMGASPFLFSVLSNVILPTALSAAGSRPEAIEQIHQSLRAETDPSIYVTALAPLMVSENIGGLCVSLVDITIKNCVDACANEALKISLNEDGKGIVNALALAVISEQECQRPSTSPS